MIHRDWITIGVVLLLLRCSYHAAAHDSQKHFNTLKLDVVDGFIGPGRQKSGTVGQIKSINSGKRSPSRELLLFSQEKIGPKIIGGKTVNNTKYPFYAQLLWAKSKINNDTFLCGASLIHSDILLSAAQCTIGNYTKIKAVIGAYSRNYSVQGFVRTVSKISVHPNWNEKEHSSDYVVMKLNQPVPLPAVKLNADPSLPVVNETLAIIGLGDIETDNETLVLQRANVKYIDPVNCNNAFNSFNVSVNATEEICAWTPGRGVCDDDYGGPVLNSKGIQVGVNSWGLGCGINDLPSVSARVSSASTWIKEQVCALSAYPPLYCAGVAAVPKTKVRVDVQFYKQSQYASFSIRNSTPGLFLYNSGPTGQATPHSNFVTKTLSLHPGFYYLKIASTNATGGGFVAAFAILNGRYKQILHSISGAFQGSFEYYSIPVPKAVAPTRTSNSSTTQVVVEIFYDYFSEETGWAIYNASNGKYVTGDSSGGLFNYGLHSQTVSLIPGKYTFRILDSYGNGFCCNFGVGYYSVHAKVKGGYVALVAPTYGFFRNSMDTLITVPSVLPGRSGS